MILPDEPGKKPRRSHARPTFGSVITEQNCEIGSPWKWSKTEPGFDQGTGEPRDDQARCEPGLENDQRYQQSLGELKAFNVAWLSLEEKEYYAAKYYRSIEGREEEVDSDLDPEASVH